MKKHSLIFLMLLLVLHVSAAEPTLPALPAAVSNNAVAALKVGKQLLLFSLMGIGAGKTWRDITNAVYQLEVGAGKWSEIRPVPGTAGRVAATASSAHEQIFLFGGYVVDAQGGEITVPDVNVYEATDHRWYRGADMPVPVDDSVAGTYRDRFIYVISGWSKNRPVQNVQIYDTEKNIWKQATAIPGTPVFGHAGALLDDTIVYIDGATKNGSSNSPRYVASDECWLGKIDHHDPTKIGWTKIESHPGSARYRIAAGASEKDKKIYFFGGTDNPYNYNGIGYDGRPAEPSGMLFAWNLRTSKWEIVKESIPHPTMDHRGLLVIPAGLVVLGGMEKGQQVTSQVTLIPRK